MRVVFLDIDGVLNSGAFYHRTFAERGPARSLRERQHLDPDSIRCLNAITDRTGARIVVSSTWRLRRDFREVVSVLADEGMTGEVIGRTPRLSGAGIVRGHEIAAWLQTTIDPLDGMVILDDDSDMAHLLPWLVKTDNELGLSLPDVERAVGVLQAPAWGA